MVYSLVGYCFLSSNPSVAIGICSIVIHMLHYHANNHFKSKLAAVLLKRLSGAEGERIDVQKLFGYIGLFTLVTLWWLGKDSLKDDFL